MRERLHVLRKRDDDLERAVLQPERDHRAQTADERECRVVAGDHARAEALDAFPSRESGELSEERSTDPPALPLVDDGECDLRLRRARVAHEAGHADRSPAGDLDGGNRLATAAADVDELFEVGIPQDGLRPVEAEPARAIGETTEDVEDRSPLPRAEPPDSNVGGVLTRRRMCWDDHAPMVAAQSAGVPFGGHVSRGSEIRTLVPGA